MTTLLLVIAIALGFYVAWNIGANDVANAMGTSVGSGALTLVQACILAGIFEFAGALLVGGHVSETIESGVVSPALFEADPHRYIYGMLACLLAAGVWLQIASYFGWPVSTTHSIIGALLGFGLIAIGARAIHWGNVIWVLTAWVVSPVIGGILAYILFGQICRRILYVRRPIAAAKRMTPYLVFLMFVILSLMVLYNGVSSLRLDFGFWAALGIACLAGLIAALISILLVRRIPTPTQHMHHAYYEGLETQTRTVERIFAFLQILSACSMAFAHGANDVANAIGPLSGVVSMITMGHVVHRDVVPLWILTLGGVGIVVGLATWGWRVIRTVGKRITALTPTRGFSAEFSAATTTLIASRLGLPISTTHTLVGAVLGVGVARGIGAINLRTIRNIGISWVITVPAGAVLAILFYEGFLLIL